jgi:hypothetical protein
METRKRQQSKNNQKIRKSKKNTRLKDRLKQKGIDRNPDQSMSNNRIALLTTSHSALDE